MRIPIIDQHRSRRIIGLLCILWLLAAVDLILTCWADQFTLFYEQNPIARMLLDCGMLKTMAAFKMSLLAAASTLFWMLRRHRSSEGALWVLALAYVALMFQWSAYTANADEMVHYREIADFAGTPIIYPTSRFAPTPSIPQANKGLITLAGSTPVRRISKPW